MGSELNGHTMVGRQGRACLRRGEHASVVPLDGGEPGAHLVCPSGDLGVLGLAAEGRDCPAGGLRGPAVSHVVLDASDQERQQEVASGLDQLVRAARQKGWEGPSGADLAPDAYRSLDNKEPPRRWAWGFVVERLTRIELAL